MYKFFLSLVAAFVILYATHQFLHAVSPLIEFDQNTSLAEEVGQLIWTWFFMKPLVLGFSYVSLLVFGYIIIKLNCLLQKCRKRSIPAFILNTYTLGMEVAGILAAIVVAVILIFAGIPYLISEVSSGSWTGINWQEFVRLFILSPLILSLMAELVLYPFSLTMYLLYEHIHKNTGKSVLQRLTD